VFGPLADLRLRSVPGLDGTVGMEWKPESAAFVGRGPVAASADGTVVRWSELRAALSVVAPLFWG